MANTGIMHLAYKPGARPYCNTRRAIMSTTPSEAKGWTRICIKCASNFAAMKARQAARELTA